MVEDYSKAMSFGLRFKLTLLIEGIIVLLVVCTGIITTYREKTALENELYKRGLALATDLAEFATSPLLSRDLPTLRRFVNHSMAQDYVQYVILTDPQGRIVMHSNLSEVGKQLDDDPAPNRSWNRAAISVFTRLPEANEMHCDLSVQVMVAGTNLGTVRLGYSYQAVEKEIAKARQQIVYIGLFTIVIGGVAAYLLASFIATPVKRIIMATEAVADGNLNPDLQIRRSDEIGTLSASFTKMAAELGKHRRQLEDLVQIRTAALEDANAKLTAEIDQRRRTQEELTLSRERLRELAHHLQSVREEEARRIAREIHDELGQALTALKIDLHWIDGNSKADPVLFRAKTAKMAALVDTTVKTVRRISSELRPGLLDDFGLSAAMEWQTREFSERVGIPCDFTSWPEDIVLDQKRSVAIFRILQEALTNIARHAAAAAVTVYVRETDSEILLTVGDDGIGVTEKTLRETKSFGIIGMRERVNDLGGTLDVSGRPNAGTTVSVRIPKEDTQC